MSDCRWELRIWGYAEVKDIALWKLDVAPGEAEWTLDALEELIDFYFVLPAVIQKKKDAFNKKLQEAGKPPIGDRNQRTMSADYQRFARLSALRVGSISTVPPPADVTAYHLLWNHPERNVALERAAGCRHFDCAGSRPDWYGSRDLGTRDEGKGGCGAVERDACCIRQA